MRNRGTVTNAALAVALGLSLAGPSYACNGAGTSAGPNKMAPDADMKEVVLNVFGMT